MVKFIIDIFCKDTIIGLSQFEDIRKNKLYKNKYSPLFKKAKKEKIRFNTLFIDQTAYHL